MDNTNIDQILGVQNIIKHAPIVIWAIDINGKFTLFQGNGLANLGQRETDIVGLQYADHYKDYPELLGAVKKALRGEHFTEDFFIDKKWLTTTFSPITQEEIIIGISTISIDITEKKLVEDKLKESEDRFRMMADSTPVLMWLTDTAGSCVWVNKTFLSFTGQSLKDVCGKGWMDLFHPEDIKRCSDNFIKNFTNQTPFENSFRLRHHSGDYRWVLDRGLPRFSSEGGFEGFIGAGNDIQDETLAKEDLKLREGYYRSLVDSLPLIVWTAKSDGSIDYCNERWYEFTGFQRNMTAVHSWERILHPDDSILSLREWKDAVKNGKPYEMQFRFYDQKSDSYRWYLGRAMPAKGSDGKIVKWFGSFTDIHGQKLVEETALMILETIPQGIWRTNAEGVADYVSLKFLENVGHPRKELLGQEWTKKIHPDDYDRVIQTWDGFRKEGLPVSIEFRIKTKKGPYKWILSLGNPFFDKKGNLTHYYGTWTDISAQIDAISARDEFLSIASHELKTPLTSLIIQTQMHRRLIERKDDKAFNHDYIMKVQNQTEVLTTRLARLIDDMLDISRIKSGKLHIEKSQTDIHSIINDVINRLLPNLIASGCGAPAVHSGSIVGSWDPLRIEQVIINLLTNAMRYGKGQPINITVKQKEDHIQIAIQDFGIGISPEDIQKIFKRFERAVNANDISGLGLGLFIAEQIVIAHTGKIWVESTVGVGSTFFVELPL